MQVTDEMVDAAAQSWLRLDPNWQAYHMPGFDPHEVKYQSGHRRMSTSLLAYEDALSEVRQRARAALSAALAAMPVGDEPVAWQRRYKTRLGRWLPWAECSKDEAAYTSDICETRALYASPLASKGERDGWQPTHRHKKRGTTYVVVGDAQVHAEEPLTDNDLVTVYRGQLGGLWARRKSEFEDGRFEVLSAAPSSQVEGEQS